MRRLSCLLVVVVLLAACSGDDGPELGFAEVTSGEVVQTVAAAAQLEPAGRVTVTAPLGGEVVELLVSDGDEVRRGDPLVRLTSDSLDQQLAQAEAAVAAADQLAAAADGASGFDLSPVFGSFRSQLDAVFPPMIGALRGQLDAVEAAAEQAAAAAERAAEEADAEVDADPALAALQAQVDEARARVTEAERGYQRARGDLIGAEQEAAASASAAEASQAAAVAAQRDQAEAALRAAEGRSDDLLVEAPAAGVVELARGGTGPGAGGVPDLGSLGADALGGDLEGLLGGAPGDEVAGPLAEGVAVGPGQPLLTIYDLSGFTAGVEVDEIDIVEVEEGQGTTVLIDAFPDREFRGVVRHVAIAPVVQPQGGAVFPVTVELVDVPRDLTLRVGLTASAEIEVRRVDAATVVPTSALLRRSDDEVVYVVRDGVARQVPVEVTAIGDETAAVEGALEVGERIVTTGVELVGDGDEIAG